jgi:hypothetical protein
MVKCTGETEWHKEPDGSDVGYNMFVLEDGRRVQFYDLPIGAMWVDNDCSDPQCKGPERGGCLVVKLPSHGHVPVWYEKYPTWIDGNAWHMDHSSTVGDDIYWTRTGEPPNVSATPSINMVGLYHGYVTNGQVTDPV